jgi:hypothetical protein
MDFEETGCEGVDWIRLAQVDCFVHGSEPSYSVKGGGIS